MRLPTAQWFYRKYERYVPLLVFATGFIWDSITMTRVDSVLDQLILSSYAAAIGAMIVFTLRRQAGGRRPAWVCKLEPYFLWAMQFAFGGLFSSFVIFYFMSVSWTRTLLFFVLCVILLVGNEFLHHRLQNPQLLAALYSFCLFSYLALLLPTILASVTTRVFLLSGAISVGLSMLVFVLGVSGSWRAQWTSLKSSLVSIAAVYISINLLYFGNLIPPVPLALKTAGIYHHVQKISRGYEVRYLPPPFYRFWRKWDDPFYCNVGETAYCYTAIFAPPRIHIPVRHVWSEYRPGIGWTVTDRIAFEISGGREGGYRGFTWKRIVHPGKWRVEVETYDGRILGLIGFTVVPGTGPHPRLVTRLIP
jgi:hypothetical protein